MLQQLFAVLVVTIILAGALVIPWVERRNRAPLRGGRH